MIQSMLAEHSFLSYPIFISGSGRSGTTLMWQLLDGHPELLVWPFECPTYTDINRTQALLGSEQLRVRDYNATLFARSGMGFDRLGEVFDDGTMRYSLAGIDKEAFFRFFEDVAEEKVSRKDYIQLLMLGYYKALKSPPKAPKRFVIKCNEFYLAQMAADFPDYRFVHMTRDPLATYRSMKLYLFHLNQHYPALAYYTRDVFKPSLMYRLKNLLGMDSCVLLHYVAKILASVRFQQRVVDNVQVRHVALEGLQDDAASVMKEMVTFLDIAETESLMHPTVLGEAAEANSVKSRAVGAVQSSKAMQSVDGVMSKTEEEWLRQLVASAAGDKNCSPLRGEQLNQALRSNVQIKRGGVFSNARTPPHDSPASVSATQSRDWARPLPPQGGEGPCSSFISCFKPFPNEFRLFGPDVSRRKPFKTLAVALLLPLFYLKHRVMLMAYRDVRVLEPFMRSVYTECEENPFV